MAQEPDILEYTAFSDDPAGGNPAGVVLDASGLDDAEMQAIATRLDHAETAFVTGEPDGDVELRYFSPIAEVPFCGHATIATAVALAERRGAGLYRFRTAAGDGVYEARNLFPVGRITEDPATGSAAAAVGGYLRALGLVAPPARVEIRQGRHIGRPGTLVVDIPPSGGITVSGTAVPLA